MSLKYTAVHKYGQEVVEKLLSNRAVVRAIRIESSSKVCRKPKISGADQRRITDKRPKGPKTS